MTNNKLSWYTIVHPDYEGWPAPPIYRLVGPAIEQSGEITCDIYYKPNRKGGHRNNYLKNVYKRMPKCNICGKPIMKYEGFKAWFIGHICMDCYIEDQKESAGMMGIPWERNNTLKKGLLL